MVATAVAGNRPDLVENLVLIAGWLRTDVHQQIRNDVWHGVTRLDEHIARKFTVMSSFSPAFLRLRTPEERQRLVDSVTFDEFKTAQMNLNRRIDITAEADRVRAQTLIIGCRDDMMVPTHHSKQLLGAIVNARYVEVAAGHAVVVERPAELVHWIDTFNRDPRRYPAGTIIENPRP